SATIAEIASLNRMMRAFWLVANVPGSSSENSTTTPSQTITAPYALSLNLRGRRRGGSGGSGSADGADGGAVTWVPTGFSRVAVSIALALDLPETREALNVVLRPEKPLVGADVGLGQDLRGHDHVVRR